MILQKIVELIFTLEPKPALELYRVYLDTIRVSRDMEKLYELRYLMTEFELR